ncbi:mannose-6-phosphate receptor binding domain-containing protein [Flagelloscypha sp. PMI_526]|nr:mannose-6-phosphate receptor binding domain-containing protein [Flagelloscypha sp. PMI_526]
MALRSSILSTLVLFLWATSAVAEDSDCTLTNDEGKYFDLTRLRGKDYDVTLPQKGDESLYFSPCKPVTEELVGDNYETPVAGFVRGGSGGDYSIGKSTTNLTWWDDRIKMTLVDGSKCSDGSKTKSEVHFICDRSVFGSGTPKVIFPSGQLKNACNIMIEWKTHLACPTSPPSSAIFSFFAVLAVLVLIALALYLLLGTAYNRYVLGLQGFDQIPSFTWEGFRWHVSEMLDLARDWFQGSSFGTPGLRNAERGWNIQTPASASAAADPSPWSHQSTVPNGGGARMPQPKPFPRGGGVPPQPFSKPQPVGRAGPPRGLNPASHFTQSQSQDGPPPPPKDDIEPSLGSAGAEFSLGEGDDEGEEMKTPPGPKSIALPTVGEGATKGKGKEPAGPYKDSDADEDEDSDEDSDESEDAAPNTTGPPIGDGSSKPASGAPPGAIRL